MATRPITPEETAQVDELVARGRAAMREFEGATQEQVDRLCQAVGWAVANETTFKRLALMGVEESGIGDPESRISKRFKVMGILRDVLRQKSIGVIETLPEKGIVKYAKPVGVIASLVPTTNPELTPPGVGIFAIKCRDAVVFSPHPRSKRTTRETVEIMRRALAREGAPVDLLQCLERPSIPAAQYLMAQADLVQATGGRDMVKAAYSSGTPAYGVGAGNSTMVIDETADVAEAARNTRMSKTSDFGSGCSADGNLIVEATIYDALRDKLIEEGAHLASEEETELLRVALWDDEGHRTGDTIAISAQQLAVRAGFEVAADRKFFLVEQTEIGPHNVFSSEKLGVVLSMFRYSGFENALEMVKAVYEVGGKGHSCGIYSFDDEHVDRLARMAPVSRIMVRQPQSKANAGAFNNGMPMTSSLGCGTWGGNITSENIHLKHYMNVTWVSRPIAEDRPSEPELFGEFYGTAVD
ncbi:MAG TPA: aldehyde dehydrogenase family protein [Candidatus Limnocylindrales bacterium]|nr:aldehyde dehydrogenase family protein [Candidatus Limnocylindrales bacterium]